MRWISFLAALAVSQPLLGQATPDPVPSVTLSAPSAELPSYELSGSPDEGLYFVVKAFPLTQGPAVQAMIGAEAERRCAPKIAFTGGYRTIPGDVTVKGETEAGIARYERTELCVEPMKPIEPAPNDFKPSSDDEHDLLSAFHTYFSAFDAEDVDALMRLRDYPPFPRKLVLQEIRDSKLQYGQQERIVKKTSWYPNPPELHNGIFGEVLYRQTVSKTRSLCGAAMFYKRATHDYVLSRILTLPIDESADGTSEDRQASPC